MIDDMINTDIEGLQTSKTGNVYVTNDVLLKQIMLSKEQDQLTDDALQMLMLMIKRIQTLKYYAKNEDREDCFQQAVLDCLLYWRGFDPEKSNNPFGYFTSIISNGINKGWKRLHPENKSKEPIIFSSIDNNIFSI